AGQRQWLAQLLTRPVPVRARRPSRAALGAAGRLHHPAGADRWPGVDGRPGRRRRPAGVDLARRRPVARAHALAAAGRRIRAQGGDHRKRPGGRRRARADRRDAAAAQETAADQRRRNCRAGARDFQPGSVRAGARGHLRPLSRTMTDSSTSTARGLFVRGARPRWLWLVVPVTLLYLALEFSFSAALLDVIGGTPDDARVRAIEHWGRLLSGFALALVAWPWLLERARRRHWSDGKRLLALTAVSLAAMVGVY